MSLQSSTLPPRATTPVVLVPSDISALDATLRCTPPPDTKLRPASTPLSNKISGHLPYSSVPLDQDEEYRLRLASETTGLFLGPVPCKSFLDTFLPLASESGTVRNRGAQHKFKAMLFKDTEAEMYKPFVSIPLPSHHLYTFNIFKDRSSCSACTPSDVHQHVNST